MGDPPDYGAYHATLIADPALPGKWQLGEEMIYLVVFRGTKMENVMSKDQIRYMLSSRLAETLPIPILDNWAEALWKDGEAKNLIGELVFSGDCLEGYWVHIKEVSWTEILSQLLSQRLIDIP